MKKYTFILKNEKTKKYRLISQLLVLFNLLGFVFLLVNNEATIAKNLTTCVCNIDHCCVYFFYSDRMDIKKSIARFLAQINFWCMCSCMDTAKDFGGSAIILFLFILLDFIAHKKLVVNITDKTIIVPYIMQKDN